MNQESFGNSDASSVGAVPGGAFIRFVAAFLDGCIVGVITVIPTLVITIVAASLDDEGALQVAATLFNNLLSVAAGILYYGWFYKNRGATPGKMLFRLRVVDVESGSNIGYGKTVLRQYLGAFVCMLTLGIGYLIIPFRADKRGLHDFIAGTQVIRLPQ